MADKIRERLEKFVPDLLLLQKRKVFSSEEVRDILRRREEMEYQLERRTHGLKDYMKVLDYEYKLERLRRQRTSELKLRNFSSRDFAILKRIIFLWDRIMNRFRYNVDLWKQYLCFCYKIESKKQFFKVVTNALRFNPYNEDLWIIGATYEFEVAKNPFKARKIYYQALKSNSKNLRLWSEYLNFELSFLDLVSKREEVQSQGLEFIPLDQQDEDAEVAVVKTEPKLEGIRKIIQLMVESCGNRALQEIARLLKEFGQEQLLTEVVNNHKLEAENLDPEEIDKLAVYLESHGKDAEKMKNLIKSSGPQALIQIFEFVKSNGLILDFIEDLATKGDQKINEQLIEFIPSVPSPLQQLRFSHLLGVQCSSGVLEECMKLTLRLKDKREILQYLLLLIEQGADPQEILNIAKVSLLTKQQLFEQFLDRYLKLQINHSNLLEWLLKQQQYCPLKYHLQNETISYPQLMKLMEYFPSEEQNAQIVQYILKKYPQKSQEIAIHLNQKFKSQAANMLPKQL